MADLSMDDAFDEVIEIDDYEDDYDVPDDEQSESEVEEAEAEAEEEADEFDDEPATHGSEEANQYYTLPVLTQFEYAAIIGYRATMIANNMPPLIVCNEKMTARDIAEEEFNQGKIPLNIVRPIPDPFHPGKFLTQVVKPNDLRR